MCGWLSTVDGRPTGSDADPRAASTGELQARDGGAGRGERFRTSGPRMRHGVRRRGRHRFAGELAPADFVRDNNGRPTQSTGPALRNFLRDMIELALLDQHRQRPVEAEFRGRTAQLDAHWHADGAHAARLVGSSFGGTAARRTQIDIRSASTGCCCSPWFRPARAGSRRVGADALAGGSASARTRLAAAHRRALRVPWRFVESRAGSRRSSRRRVRRHRPRDGGRGYAVDAEC